jgi:hypothetical protein
MAQTNMFSGEGFFMAGMTPNSGMVLCESMDVGLTATGSTAAGALQLNSSINVMATVAASTGVRLPAVDAAGAGIVILNGGASVLTVYPPTGGVVNGGTVNAADAGTVAAVSSGVPGKQTYRNLGGTPAAYVRA